MGNSVCPWWMGYFLLMPVRNIIQNPDKILSKYVTPKMKVLDIGCGMGFFSLPLARMVGEQGRVFSIDLQRKMIKALEKRAEKAGLGNRIQTQICNQHSLQLQNLKEEMDMVLAFAMVHEVPDQDRLFREIYQVLKTGGCLLMVEPKGHVNQNSFQDSLHLAEQTGFHLIEVPHVGKSHAVLFQK
jgi:ubiquinone/menaquinone biosynthesis C-methylase UbiE